MNAITTRPNSGASLAPANMAEAMKFAELLANSTMVPKDFIGKPGNVLVAVQWGAELGLGPMQALQGIAVINGRPTLWGDAALALVQGHPAYAGHKEGVEGEGDDRTAFCTITRRGADPETRRFSVADAKKAGLWGKAGPWQQYPERMLQLRARGFALRDVFADALRGVITREEAQDIPAEPRDVPSVRQPEPVQSRPTLPGGLVESLQNVEKLPLVGPDGALHQIQKRSWLAGVKRALASLHSPTEIGAWRASNGAHLAAIAENDADLVKEAEAAITARVADFAPEEQEMGDAYEPEDVA